MKLHIKRNAVLFISVPVLMFCLPGATTFTPPDIDHAAVIKSLNKTTLEKGRQIYIKSCIACHGADGTASNPQARSFGRDKLRFGNKPYDMWRTISNGAGGMAPQTWLSPVERYYVIQYIRETFMKKSNPGQYFKITESYLAKLPKPQRSVNEQLALTKKQALLGSQKYGQEYFQHINSNYGTAIHSQLKDRATATLTILLDHHINLSYNLLRMGTVAVWQGKLNLQDTKYKKYRGEGQPFIQGAEIPGLGLWQWTYGDQLDSLQKSTGVRTPLPTAYLDYHGHYVYKKDIVLSYAIAGRNVLEFPQAIKTGGQIILSQTLSVSPGESAQKIYIGHLENGNRRKSKDITALINPES
ncbi:MAG: cytochrome c, partial [Bacteroidota bacterium]|nr:cytochrome c [Bacteroidota bacterium]